MKSRAQVPVQSVVIACGGTGGHFFPGLAVGQELERSGVSVRLLASQKAVDQNNAAGYSVGEVAFLPSVGFVRGRRLAFLWGLLKSLGLCARWFSQWRPQVVLVMGGFTSVAPALVGRLFGAKVFLHEANSVPGRANRLLARLCSGVFVGFPAAKNQFGRRTVTVTGTPVRDSFRESVSRAAASRWGLDPKDPILLVMGGSQGARALNQLLQEIAPVLAFRYPHLQFVHLTGPADAETMEALYRRLGVRHYVAPYLSDTSVLIRMASVVLSRAGASSLAEYAAVRVPALLVPYPAAVDDHQKINAQEFVDQGAATMLNQRELRPSEVIEQLSRLLFELKDRNQMMEALAAWDSPRSAQYIAELLLGRSDRPEPPDREETPSEPTLEIPNPNRGSKQELRRRVVALF